MKQTVFITIGEAPRHDIADTYDTYFGANSMVSQRGLLDNFSYAEALVALGKTGQEASLVTTFADGQFIKLSHQKVEQALQQLIKQLEEQGVELVVILCTAEFKTLHTVTAELVEPEKLILPLIKKRFGHENLGVFIPLPEQLAESVIKWQEVAENVYFVSASPYEYDEIVFKKALEQLLKAKVNVIILDCMGYNRRMKDFLKQWTNIEIYQANELLFEHIIEKIN